MSHRVIVKMLIWAGMIHQIKRFILNVKPQKNGRNFTDALGDWIYLKFLTIIIKALQSQCGLMTKLTMLVMLIVAGFGRIIFRLEIRK